MARAKKTTQTEEEQQIILTKEQLALLTDLSSRLNSTKNTVHDIGTDEDLTDRGVGFVAGKVYLSLDAMEDELDELLDAITPSESDDESEDNDW